MTSLRESAAGSLLALCLCGACAAPALRPGAPGSAASGPFAGRPQEPGLEAEIRVQLAQAPTSGTLRVLLFDSADAFGDLRDALRIERWPADGRSSLILPDVEPGEYALLVHLDEDDDGALDRNVLGIPIEPIAFSNGYRPKGPPAYARAAFLLGPGVTRTFELELARPLGERGRLSVGLGAVGQSSPYVDYDGNVVRLIPALAYNGTRLQVLGPRLSYGLAGTDRLRLAATGRYRLGAYEEDESPALAGLGDREDTLMAGLALTYELPGNVDLGLGYDHDLLDRAGGGSARFTVDRPFQLGVARLSPRLGLRWLDSDLAGYDFGVPAPLALPGRPAYDPGDTLSWELGLGAFVELSESWRLIVDVGVQFLDDDIERSPIVETGEVIQGFVSLNYTF